MRQNGDTELSFVDVRELRDEHSAHYVMNIVYESTTVHRYR